MSIKAVWSDCTWLCGRFPGENPKRDWCWSPWGLQMGPDRNRHQLCLPSGRCKCSECHRNTGTGDSAPFLMADHHFFRHGTLPTHNGQQSAQNYPAHNTSLIEIWNGESNHWLSKIGMGCKNIKGCLHVCRSMYSHSTQTWARLKKCPHLWISPNTFTVSSLRERIISYNSCIHRLGTTLLVNKILIV